VSSIIGLALDSACLPCWCCDLPAVVGTGNAVTTIKTGQMLRVDGNSGVVTLLY
jgi:pyruvate,water dikinase